MTHEEEVQAGIELLKRFLAQTDVSIASLERVSGREIYNFVFARVGNTHQLTIPSEFLSDLMGTKEYIQSAREYIGDLKNRLLNVSSLDFYSLSGAPLNIRIDWPFERVPNRDAIALQVYVQDLRKPDTVATVAVYMTGHQSTIELMADPFLRERSVVNTIRRLADKNALKFFSRGEHSTELPFIPLDTSNEKIQGEELIQEFILGKVFWLGFKRRDRRTPVFIADRWDAQYLGIDAQILIQTAQILEAQDMIILDSSQEFASAARGLLVRAQPSKLGAAAKGKKHFEDEVDFNPRPLWDVFICHASEDKEAFVEPLAQALRHNGVRVWYDEFELKLGDSLRRSIDRGLRDSQYGVVVFSHAFFSKEWPQKELDGLAAREIEGEKVILPVWHKITRKEVLAYSPPLADRMAASSDTGIKSVVQKIMQVIVGF